jgi:hypothetical protein
MLFFVIKKAQQDTGHHSAIGNGDPFPFCTYFAGFFQYVLV